MDIGIGKGIFTKKPGLPPGTLVHVGEVRQKKVDVTLIQYDEKNYHLEKVRKIDDLSKIVSDKKVSWINIDGLNDTKLLERIFKDFDINYLAQEDILNTNQRPKVDYYKDHLLTVIKMVAGKDDIEQISIIFKKDLIITIQERKGDVFDPIRERIRDKRGRIRNMQADYLLYALVDSVVDNYFPILEGIDDRIEDLEDELADNPKDATLKEIYKLKSSLVQLRRSIWPLREVISSLQKDGLGLISDEIDPYWRDLYDHTIRIMDMLESLRDMTSGLMDLYMSVVSNRMNEVMKVLTIIATIFIPLSFITGLYGMNFDTTASPLNMPELGFYWGYPMALSFMLMVVLGMMIYFKKKKWM